MHPNASSRIQWGIGYCHGSFSRCSRPRFVRHSPRQIYATRIYLRWLQRSYVSFTISTCLDARTCHYGRGLGMLFLIVAFLILVRNVFEFWFSSDCLVLYASGSGLRRQCWRRRSQESNNQYDFAIMILLFKLHLLLDFIALHYSRHWGAEKNRECFCSFHVKIPQNYETKCFNLCILQGTYECWFAAVYWKCGTTSDAVFVTILMELAE